MGFVTEFNWVLKLKPEQGFPEEIKEGLTFEFKKQDYRVYPVGIPVYLVDKSWVAVALVLIKEISWKDDSTQGKAVIVKVFSEEEKEVATRLLRKTVEVAKGEKIEDFDGYKMT
ncbi:MAG: hypothetical protein DRN30_04875 [Thermoplasmata archaeon]|nr:MAG: hypothetical protein DRN30_04875 [Thermoplasmata archaeon]